MKKEDTQKPAWKSFWSLLVVQAQNSFNDKVAQFMILPLAAWLTLNQIGDYASVQYILGVVVILPYLLLAPLAGWLSDRFPKTFVVRATSLSLVLIFGLILISLKLEWFWGVVLGFFLLAVQSVIMSPAKRGLVKELVGEEKLGSASGILEMSVLLTICLGQIAGGFWFDHELGKSGDGWNAMFGPVVLLTLVSAVPIALSMFIRNTGAKGTEETNLRQTFDYPAQMKSLFSTRAIGFSVLGKSFFWGFAGIFNLWQIVIANDLLEAEKLRSEAQNLEVTMQSLSIGGFLSNIMIAASVGVVVGGVIASLLSRKRVEIGLAPIGLLIIILGVVLMAFFHAGQPMMYAALVITGFGSAFYLVPVNGFLQNIIPSSQRGEILAGSSVLDCLFGLGALGLQFALAALGFSLMTQAFLVIVILCVVLCITLRVTGQELVRLVLRTIFKRLYNITAQGVENIPEEGGVLLTPNHVTYLDTLILSCACPRPVRFLMVQDCFATRGVGAFARFFNTIPISRERAKEAITKAADALEEGTVVCIFPEGQLTRTGALCELKRGFEMIARRAKAPVVPVYMDGLWGTLTSFEREKMYWKKPRLSPRGTRVHFGAPLLGKEQINVEGLKRSMVQLSHNAMIERKEVSNERKIRKQVHRSSLPGEMKARILAMDWKTLQPYVFNAIQLREMAVFRDHQRMGYEEGTEGEVVIALLCAITRSKVWTLPKGQKADFTRVNACDFLFISEALSPLKSQIRNATVFEVNGDLLTEGELDAKFFPGMVENGLFTLFSIPHPKKISPSDPLQPGWKPHSYGRLLPGARDYMEGDAEFFVTL